MKELDHTLKKFTRNDGPFVRATDQALASHVEQQAYYSGSFTGKHVH